MPQMSPMNWVGLFLYFYSVYNLILVKIAFSPLLGGGAGTPGKQAAKNSLSFLI